MKTCPCNPEIQFSECCAPILTGHVKPPTAEALMRSRYTAYVQGDFEYLLKTWHSEKRDKHVDFGAQDGIRWNGLEIISTEDGRKADSKGIVEFKVYYEKDGQQRVLHERSRFGKEQDDWFYIDGDIIPAEPARSMKVGRNELCPCKSGKKYKKCCLRNKQV